MSAESNPIRVIRSCLIGIGGLLVACEAGPGTDPSDPDANPTPPELTAAVVSNPTKGLAARAGGGPSLSGAAVTDVAYISLPPGALPDVELLRVRNPGNGAVSEVALIEGGFDPVAIPASVGDTLDVTVRTIDGLIEAYVIVVPDRRPPIVIRTDPPPRKRDVPLNAAMLVVFSEPVDPRTVTPQTVQLLLDGQPVAGAVTVDADGWRVEFQPAQVLAPNADYQLVVTVGVTDLTGDALPQAVTTEFTTTSPTTADVTPPLVTLRSPVDGDTVALGFTTFRIGVTDDQNLPDLLVEIHYDDAGEFDIWMGDQTNDFADLTYGIFALAAGPHTIRVVTRDAAGNTGSTAPATITVVDPDTASRIIIRSFSVVEFQYEEYPGQWYYAPQLVAAEAPGGSGLEIVGFEMLTIPGLPSSFSRMGAGEPRPAAARSLTVSLGADVQLFEYPGVRGGYPLDYHSPGNRSVGSSATGRLVYRDASGHLYATTVQGPIVSGGTETYNGWYCGHWPPPLVWPSVSRCPG